MKPADRRLMRDIENGRLQVCAQGLQGTFH